MANPRRVLATIDPATLRRALALPFSLPAIPLPREARPSAVLVPVLLEGGPPRVLLQVRAASLRDHGGELGFPGGKPEPGDPDLQATALRECIEELGLAAPDIHVLGPLSVVPVITGKYLLHPFAALIRGCPALRLSPELDRLIEVPLLPWIEGVWSFYGTVDTWRGATFLTPFFRLQDDREVLYGASAVIFYELLVRVARALGGELPAPAVVEEQPWGDRYKGVHLPPPPGVKVKG